MTTRVRKATRADFDAIHGVVLGFNNDRMSKDDWRRMLVDYPWRAESDDRGYLLLDDDKPVGFLGTIFSSQPIDGRPTKFCHLACWIVAEAYRSSSIQLVMPVLSLKSYNVVNLSASERAYEIFKSLRFKELDDAIVQLPPVSSPRDLYAWVGGSVVTKPEEIRALLGGDDLVRFDDLKNTNCAHILIRSPGRQCYAIATRHKQRAIPFAHVHFMSDPALFWGCSALAKWGFFRTLGAAALMIDSRFARGHRLPLHRWHPLKQRRLYKPADPNLAPAAVTALYSDLMQLK